MCSDINYSNWVSSSIQVNGADIHYYLTGQGKPSLLLLHGFTDSGLCWSRVASALEDDYSIVMVDARGHGLSERVSAPFSVSDYASDTLSLIHSLSLEGVSIVGHSLGASAAALIAASHPNLVRCLVLEDPAWTAEESQTESRILDADERWLLDASFNDYRAFISACREKAPNWAEVDVFHWIEAQYHFDVNILKLPKVAQPPWRNTVSKISCHGLLLYGEAELGAIVSDDVAIQVSSLWNCCEGVCVPGAGHSIHREQYSTYLALLTRFLEVHLAD